MFQTMAQPSRWRPAIHVRPEAPRVGNILRLPPNDTKSRLAIGVEGSRVVEGVGVEGQAGMPQRKPALDSAVEQPGADAPADIAERQTEEDDLAGQKLEVADEVAGVAGDMQLMGRRRQNMGQRPVGENAALVPQPRPADAVVEVAIEGDGRSDHRRNLDPSVGRYTAPRP